MQKGGCAGPPVSGTRGVDVTHDVPVEASVVPGKEQAWFATPNSAGFRGLLKRRRRNRHRVRHRLGAGRRGRRRGAMGLNVDSMIVQLGLTPLIVESMVSRGWRPMARAMPSLFTATPLGHCL